jgi:hypothetical protein
MRGDWPSESDYCRLRARLKLVRAPWNAYSTYKAAAIFAISAAIAPVTAENLSGAECSPPAGYAATGERRGPGRHVRNLKVLKRFINVSLTGKSRGRRQETSLVVSCPVHLRAAQGFPESGVQFGREVCECFAPSFRWGRRFFQCCSREPSGRPGAVGLVETDAALRTILRLAGIDTQKLDSKIRLAPRTPDELMLQHRQ